MHNWFGEKCLMESFGWPVGLLGQKCLVNSHFSD